MATRETDIKDLINNCRKLGWSVRSTKRGWIVTNPVGPVDGSPASAALSVNARRAQANGQSDLARIGYHEAWAEYERKNEEARQTALAQDRARVNTPLKPVKAPKPKDGRPSPAQLAFQAPGAVAPPSAAPPQPATLSGLSEEQRRVLEGNELVMALMAMPGVTDALVAHPELLAQLIAAKDMRASFKLITPEVALDWATRPITCTDVDGQVIRQRTFDVAWKDELKRRMLAGEWGLSPEGYFFAPDGSQLDGRHRSHAIFEAGITVLGWVVENCPPEVFHLLNEGKRRNAADALSTGADEKNLGHLASAVKVVHLYDRWAAAEDKSTVQSWPQWQRVKMSNAELTAARKRYPEMPDAVKAGSALAPRCGLTAGALASFRFIVLRANPGAADRVDTFWEGLATGTNLEHGSPIHAVREWGLRGGGRQDKRAGGASLPRRELQLHVLLKAWAKFVRGDEMRQIRYSATEPLTDPAAPSK